MALNIKNALKAYERQDTAKIDCGNGWLVELKPYSSAIKKLSKVQAELRSKGVLKTARGRSAAQLPSIALSNPGLAMLEDKENYLLGSIEEDVRFFVENIVEGWENLKDDNGAEVAYSNEAAMEVFLENGEAGHQLYRELFASSLDTTLFIQTLDVQATEDAKNS